MKHLKYTFFAIILFTLSACNETLVKQDMVEFDRAFVPAYYYAALGDVEKASGAMYPLKAKWEKFNKMYAGKKPGSDDWNESIRMVGAWLDETDCALKDGDARTAVFQLDHARYELMDLRWREGVNDYYLDYVWDLEASINVAIQVANDPMIELLDWNEFEPIVNEVIVSWMNVQQMPMDEHLLLCSPEMQREMTSQKNRLGYAIANLELAMETAERCVVADAALAMEPAYLNYMALFGDFDAAQTHFALME